MTDRKQALEVLRDQVKAGAEYIERDIQEVFGGYRDSENAKQAIRAYNGSLDAAKALNEAVLPGWWCRIIHPNPSYVQVGNPGYGIYSAECYDNPARAWLLAILSALIEQENNDP